MRCPSCREELDGALVCPQGHRFGYQGEVLVLLDQAFAQRLRPFTDRLATIRAAEGRQLLDPTIYERLPWAAELRGNHEWRTRCYDLALLRRLLRGRGPLRVLDVGAWNGWLSHQLALLGHTVTGVDYFADEHDGLGARKFYRTPWRAIQLDLGDLGVLDESFDLVILNRCLAFQSDPQAFVAAAQQLVAPSGTLVLSGLELFQDPQRKVRAVAALRRRYREQYGFELFLAPTRGYLDFGDKQALKELGVVLRPYRRLWPANLKALLRPSLPRHYYGIWRNRGNDH